MGSDNLKNRNLKYQPRLRKEVYKTVQCDDDLIEKFKK